MMGLGNVGGLGRLGYAAANSVGWWLSEAQLDLDFANDRSYNRKTGYQASPNGLLTYTSPSPKMVYGDDVVLGYAPHNAFTYSQQFDNAAWASSIGGTGVAPSVTANAGGAPDGTATADRVQFSLGGGTTSSDFSLLRQSKQIGAGKTVSMGVWLKSYDSNSYNMLLTQPDGSATAITVTPTWQFFEVSGTEAAGAVSYGLRLRGGQTPVNSNTADVLMWGARLNLGGEVFDYIPTTSAAVYSLPIDHDPITHAPLGVLIEEQRTNLLTYSEQFDNAAWTADAATVTANAVVGPNGVLSADKVVPSTASATSHRIRQAYTFTAVSTSYSVYAKSAGYDWVKVRISANMWANVNLATGAGGFSSGSTVSVVDCGNGWWRITIDGTPTAGAAFAYVYAMSSNENSIDPSAWSGDGTSGIYLWGAQLEAGAFATSYIPTVASQVTRAADSITVATSAFGFSSAAGTMVAHYKDPGVNAGLWRIDDSGDAEYMRAIRDTGNIVFAIVDGGVVTGLVYRTATAQGTISKHASTWETNWANAAIDGSVGTEDTSITLPTVSALRIGQNRNVGFLNSHLRRLTYFPTRKSNSELQALSA